MDSTCFFREFKNLYKRINMDNLNYIFIGKEEEFLDNLYLMIYKS